MKGEIETEIILTGKAASLYMPPIAEYAKVNDDGYLVWCWISSGGEIKEAGHVQFKYYLMANWHSYEEKP